MTSFDPLKVLNIDDLEQIRCGQQVFLTTWDFPELSLSHTPALAVRIDNGQFVAIYIEENGKGTSVCLTVADYGYLWYAEIKDGFALKTPYGLLQAWPIESYDLDEYPGIEVGLSLVPTDQFIRLTVTHAKKNKSGEPIGIVTGIYPNELDDENDVVPVIKSL